MPTYLPTYQCNVCFEWIEGECRMYHNNDATLCASQICKDCWRTYYKTPTQRNKCLICRVDDGVVTYSSVLFRPNANSTFRALFQERSATSRPVRFCTLQNPTYRDEGDEGDEGDEAEGASSAEIPSARGVF